ncbi:MAG: sialidase family protein [Planctomycetota bacterium]
MRSSRFLFVILAMWVCTATVAVEPDAYQPEREDQPYLPGAGQLRSGLRGVSLSPAGSVQVNVDANGLNIVGDAANEPSIAIDPTNPNRMAVGWRQFDNIASNFRQAGNAYSTDGGATWTFPGVLTPGVFRSDPVLVADNVGRFFYNSLQTTFCIDVFQSANAGMTWPTSVAAFGGDKAWMDVDRTAGIGSGFLHMAWQNAARCANVPSGRLFTRSIDHGATWLTPIAITNSPRFGVTAVGPDGAVYVTGTTSSLSTFVVAKSTNAQNGGVTPTWAFSVTGSFLGGSQTVGGGPNPAGLLGQVWIAANPLNAAHVFLLGSVDPAGSDPLDVRFARSIDGGQTWSASVKVNDDAGTTAYQWFGTMAVAPNGRIDVVWNDTRDDPTNVMSKTRYSYSTDEGVTWVPSYAFTPAWNSLVGFPSQNKIGDYYDMESDNAAAHLIYSATFNGEQDVYYTTLTPNDCNRNGISDTLDIANLTSSDCNSNGLPDECENDCNEDGIADVCQLVGNDCNSNGVPDDCEPGHEDCNNNSIFDLCEGFVDCNGNGHWDLCDIANATSVDCNGNSIPDECELPNAVAAADACANAPFVTSGVPVAGTNASATTDVGSGASCGASGRDVYYKYRPVVSGTLNLSLCAGTFFDTVMSVHTGCPATTINQIGSACDDDGCGVGGGPSIINNIAVTAGQTYLIRIAGFDNGTAGDVGFFALTLTGPTGVGDCNNDGVPDVCEIAAGGDANGNGIPDICEPFPACGTCAGDMNGDTSVDGRDITAFIGCYLVFPTVPGSCGCADMNASHQINSADVGDFVNKLLLGGCP